MTRAMLLCAGKSTRLGPIGTQCPKPLLPVCDVPILAYGITNLVAHGIREIIINTHHLADAIPDVLGDGAALGARIQYRHEPEILGTGGGLKNALDLLDPNDSDEPLVSCNGKLIFDVDITAVLAAHREDTDTLGTMVVRRTPDALEWGAVDVDVESSPRPRVMNILGSGAFMFGGVHVTRPSVLRRLPAGEACMVRQGYLPWLKGGERVSAFLADPTRYFNEHSTPDRYLTSNLSLLEDAPLTNPPAPLSGVDAGASIAESATVRPPVRIGEGAVIGERATVGPFAVIGSGATVADGAMVERSVVWPGVTVTDSLRNSIATPNGIIDCEDAQAE